MIPLDQRFQKGVELFNQQKFFECHEIIEKLWLETNGPEKDFLKGMIQAAVALHHLKHKNLSGAIELYRSAVRYLESYQPEALGLDVLKLIEDLKSCFESFSNDKQKADLKKAQIPVARFHFRTD